MRKAWRKSYLHFGSPYIGPEERAEVLACIDSGWLGTGPRVQRLEREFRQYVGARAVVAVSSATAALHLALKELRLEPGTEVKVTSTRASIVVAIEPDAGVPAGVARLDFSADGSGAAELIDATATVTDLRVETIR